MIITATKFRLTNPATYPHFFVITYRAFRQAKNSPGIVQLKINPFSLRTLTAWKSREDMINFRNNGAHLEAMKQSAKFGKIDSFTWDAESLPTWADAMRKLDSNVK